MMLKNPRRTSCHRHLLSPTVKQTERGRRDAHRRRGARSLAAAFVVLAGLTVSCQQHAARGRVIVLGLDGLDPLAVDLLMSENKLPNFARLRQNGAYGRLLSNRPLLSPIIWTTIATGKTPDLHRIGHFVAVNEKTGEQLPVTSRMRAVKALWNVLSEHDRNVGVIGWWATWPAEPINGVIVSDHTCYHFLFPEGGSGANDTTGLVDPPSYRSRVDALIRRPDSLSASELAPFVHVPSEDLQRPFDFNDELSHFKWALATAETYAAIGLDVWKTRRPDVLMVYIEGVDSTSHLFGHLFRAHDLAGELADQQRRYGDAVEQMYLYADRLLGRYLDALDSETTLVVLSDHGFQLGQLHDDPSKTRDLRRVSERYHRIEGILYLYGNHIRPHTRLDNPTLVDVAPTILQLTGIAPARDLPGRVLHEALEIPVQPRTIETFETASTAAKPAADDTGVDQAILEKLQSLGYLDTQSPSGDRNLAAIYFEEGKYEEAAKAYARLVASEPDDAALRASYGGVLGALGRYDDSLAQLDKAIELEPLNPEAYYNRGLIYERKGDPNGAVAEYRNALRYRPDYAPAAQALLRLTGSTEVNPPRTDAERLALRIAERASEAARRGDYPSAMKELDEAERIAPGLALVHQYRANVAFLSGDRATAVRALERALEIEPDNALFRENLTRLKAEKDPSK